MKKLISFALLCTIPTAAVLAEQDDLQQRANESRVVVKQFMTQLKGELGRAIKAGGPVEAINVCNKVAPAIAKSESDKHGWQVGRTSLKTRNFRPSVSPS